MAYTEEQLQDLLTCADDPLFFMENFIYIQHGTKGKMKFVPYKFQRDLVKTYWKYRNTIAMISRQAGKTTTAASYILWFASFHPDVTVLIAANKFKGASEIMSRIKFAYEELPDYIRPGVIEYNVQSIKFDNGSRIMATTTTPDSGRGLAISLLYLDEFAFVKPRIAEEFWSAISPTLATGGKCIITSTPNSDEDKFSEIWFNAKITVDRHGKDIPRGVGINDFKSFFSPYSDVPGRDEEWAEKERSKIGKEKFDREYGCCAHNTIINLYDKDQNKYIDMKIGDLYHQLLLGTK